MRIDVPRNERELDPILLTVPLQLLAYHAALTSATTSTSRATSPSRSRWSERRTIFVQRTKLRQPAR